MTIFIVVCTSTLDRETHYSNPIEVFKSFEEAYSFVQTQPLYRDDSFHNRWMLDYEICDLELRA